MIRTLLAAALLSFALTTSAQAQGLTEAQKEEVRRVVRDYLVTNPDVLDEAQKALDAKKAAERRAVIENDPRDFSIGPRDAGVTIVEFFDYQCGYCHAAMDWVFAAQASNPRDVRVVFKEFPVLGPASEEASLAAVASIKQGRYQKFHRALMTHRGQLDSTVIDTLARKADLDVARLRRDMADPAIFEHVERNHKHATDSDIRGTPAFMINGEFVRGYDKAAMDRTLAKALKDARKARRA
jgi:protein-disulfide isomerase